MDSRQVTYTNTKPGGMAGSIALALIVGAALPIVALLQISLLVPTLMLGGMMTAHLGVKRGWVPAGVLAAAAALSASYLMGVMAALILVLAALVPAVPVILNATGKKPFFEQMNAGVIAFVGGLLAAMLVAGMAFGGGMVARFVDVLRSEYDRMPDAALQPMVDWINAVLPAGTGLGGQAMTVDSFRSQLSGVLDLMQQTYGRIVPGALLSGALLSGVLGVLWANWTMARRGMASNASFVGMSGWFMPARLSLGAAGLWLVGMLLMLIDKAKGATVYMTIAQTVGAAFAVQALCALDRRLLRSDISLVRRRVLIVLLAVAALLLRGIGAALAWVGVGSAMFGSHGALRQRMAGPGNDPHDDDSN